MNSNEIDYELYFIMSDFIEENYFYQYYRVDNYYPDFDDIVDYNEIEEYFSDYSGELIKKNYLEIRENYMNDNGDEYE